MALAWVIARPGVGSTLVGASRVEQLHGNIAALDVRLTAEQGAALDEVSANAPGFTDMLATSAVRRMIFGGQDVKGWSASRCMKRWVLNHDVNTVDGLMLRGRRCTRAPSRSGARQDRGRFAEPDQPIGGGGIVLWYGSDGRAMARLPSASMLDGTWSIVGDASCIVWSYSPEDSCSVLAKRDGTMVLLEVGTDRPLGTVRRIVPGKRRRALIDAGPDTCTFV